MNKTELEKFKERITEKVQTEKDWYIKHANKKKSTSKTLRALAIIFFGLGTLCPLIDATQALETTVEFSRWGYVAFAIGGIFIGYDKFFGVSSGWIRYTLSMMEINNLTNDFEFDWELKTVGLNSEILEEEKFKEIIELLKSYLGNVQNIVINETKNWADEFESSLLELRKNSVGGNN